MSEIPEQREGSLRPGESVVSLPPGPEQRGAPWVGHVMRARNATPTGVVALARLLDDDGVPPALRALARAYVEEKLYRADRPRARGNDPETSQAAAQGVRGPGRPGGTVHRILAAYEEHARAGVNRIYEVGLTAREIESISRVKEAHKRTSELLQDGLLRVVTAGEKADGESEAERAACSRCQPNPYTRSSEHEHAHRREVEDRDVDAVRGGGRILRITPDGERLLAILNTRKRERDEATRAAAARKLSKRVRWGILEALAESPDVLTRNDLEARLGTRESVVVEWLAGHRGQELIEVTPLMRGGYATYRITDKGRAALARRAR